MGLPVLSRDLPESFRVDVARNDMALIAAQAREQVSVLDHDIRSVNEVLHSIAILDVPNRAALVKLVEQHETPLVDETIPKSKGEVIRKMTSGGVEREGVADRDITRDILSVLHPDRAIADNVHADETIFKTITEARQNEDRTLTQGLYAGTVASRAVQIESPSAATLERSRYKAWLALQAGQGRFSTIGEVDAWKDRELGLVPYKIRASLLMTARGLYAKTLGIAENGSIRLPADFYDAISGGLKSSGEVIERIMGDQVSSDDLGEKVDLELFDQRLGSLVEQLSFQLKIYGGKWQGRDQLRGDMSSQLARELAAAARVLEGGGVAYDLAMSGILKSFGRSSPFRTDKFGGSILDGIVSKPSYYPDENIIGKEKPYIDYNYPNKLKKY